MPATDEKIKMYKNVLSFFWCVVERSHTPFSVNFKGCIEFASELFILKKNYRFKLATTRSLSIIISS